MSKEDAIKIIADVCSQFKGNLADHQAIQNALKLLVEVINAEKQAE
tara:strand:- start:411 stop:548 length:138 start_codon:yes stop_codon:yes gene_type:complete